MIRSSDSGPGYGSIRRPSGRRPVSWSVLILMPLLLSVFNGCAGIGHPVGPGTSYENRLTLAVGYIRSAEGPRAVEVLKEAASQLPERPEAYAMLGDIFHSDGNLEKAVEEYRRAIEKGEEDPVVWNNLAWLESDLGYNGAALFHIEKAIEMVPFPLYPYLDTRARILGAMGNIEEARKSAVMALRLTPASDMRMRRALRKFLDKLNVGEAGR